MAPSRTAIVQAMQGIVGGANVVTDEMELKRSSVDRLHLYEDGKNVFQIALVCAFGISPTWPRLSV